MEARSFIEQLRGFGDRTAGGRGERFSQEAIAGLLGRLGYHARVEGCVCHTNPGMIWFLHALALTAGALWSVTQPWPGVVVALLAMLSLAGEAQHRGRLLRWLLPKGISSNLIARRPHTGGLHVPRILFVAHGDVARRGLIHNRVLGRPFMGAMDRFKIHPARLFLLFGWITVALIALRFPGLYLEWLDRALLVPLAFFALVMLLCLDWMRPRPAAGANDNGSGLAVLAALAEHFGALPLKNAEVCFLVTGAREAGCGGMDAFLTTFGRTLPPEDTFVVNLDDVGAGRICFAVGERAPQDIDYLPLLPGIAAALAREHEFRSVRPVTLIGLGDAGTATRHQYAALTITGLRRGQPATPVHTGRDRIRKLSRGSIMMAHAFAIAIAERLDEQLGREVPDDPEDS